MAQETTARWAMPLLHAGQAQKELFHNEALARVDVLVHSLAQSADLATPPADPPLGESWIVAGGATGAWADRDGQYASWTEGGWRYLEPAAGMRVHVVDRGHALMYDGASWQDEAVRGDGFYQAGVKVVGARHGAIAHPVGGASVDAEGRVAISAILDALREHGLIAS